QIRQLEIEREAVKREGDDAKLARIGEQLANLDAERTELRARWQQEKELIQTVQQAKEEVETLKVEAENLERSGDYGQVAEIRYGRIPQAEARSAEARKKLEEMQAGGTLLKEEVDA